MGLAGLGAVPVMSGVISAINCFVAASRRQLHFVWQSAQILLKIPNIYTKPRIQNTKYTESNIC